MVQLAFALLLFHLSLKQSYPKARSVSPMAAAAGSGSTMLQVYKHVPIQLLVSLVSCDVDLASNIKQTQGSFI